MCNKVSFFHYDFEFGAIQHEGYRNSWISQREEAFIAVLMQFNGTKISCFQDPKMPQKIIILNKSVLNYLPFKKLSQLLTYIGKINLFLTVKSFLYLSPKIHKHLHYLNPFS